MIVIVIITIMMIIGIKKSPICLLCCFASHSATVMIEGWNNVGPTPLLLSVIYIFLHGNIQSGGGGVLLQRVSFPNPY